MTTKINDVPFKKPDTETPIVADNSSNPEEQEHKKMERAADRVADKANQTHKQYDQDHNTFSI